MKPIGTHSDGAGPSLPRVTHGHLQTATVAATVTGKPRSLGLCRVDDPAVIIREGGGGFLVTVEPAPDGFEQPPPFADHKRARGYAGGLRLVHRWKIIDKT